MLLEHRKQRIVLERLGGEVVETDGNAPAARMEYNTLDYQVCSANGVKPAVATAECGWCLLPYSYPTPTPALIPA